jgi:hypothetical protein
MNRSFRLLLVCGVAAAGSTFRPFAAAAQNVLSASVLRCAATENADAFLAQVVRARDLADPDAAEAALAALEPEARAMAAEHPDDAAAQYRLAAVLGAQLDHESGKSKMKGAADVRAQAERVLALDPSHPGASYMLGRIHSSILRMSGFKRFMAKQLFGGGTLDGASWEKAQELLETAVRGEPCAADYQFELARVYAHRGNVDGAERALASVRELTADAAGAQGRLREKAAAFERDWREAGQTL